MPEKSGPGVAAVVAIACANAVRTTEAEYKLSMITVARTVLTAASFRTIWFLIGS
jgi:hypothetical protein